MSTRKLLTAVAAVSAVTLSASALATPANAAFYTCRIAGHVYSGRCPNYVAANGRWYVNRVYCIRTGRWGHC